ncbi:hypothetical protein EST62_08445 [Chlorobaculum sp. 24CR]|uniref:hypothetical protein n=1 Tax=Chlorobaculum sp. 24CR TaxID=2508878 RepID=UPI00100C25C9|nr:hypothetical protein [Chlorobaculum sp. 24CR]RXK84958.1 hypothetical protein EST62_08445 [Chlorobaculum sp. 24CR]
MGAQLGWHVGQSEIITFSGYCFYIINIMREAVRQQPEKIAIGAMRASAGARPWRKLSEKRLAQQATPIQSDGMTGNFLFSSIASFCTFRMVFLLGRVSGRATPRRDSVPAKLAGEPGALKNGSDSAEHL